MRHALALLRGRLRDVRGTSAVEFALLAPMFVILMVGVIEIGLSVRTGLQVRQAAAAGAAFASKYKYDAVKIAAAAAAATNRTGLTTTVTQSCGCPQASGFSTVCATCADGTLPRNYVVVTATLPRTGLFQSTNFGLPATLSAKAVTLPGR